MKPYLPEVLAGVLSSYPSKDLGSYWFQRVRVSTFGGLDVWVKMFGDRLASRMLIYEFCFED